MVRLKAPGTQDEQQRTRSFNSTMVRLKVQDQQIQNNRYGKFQFHNGSIKSDERHANIDKKLDVSIPQWFD